MASRIEYAVSVTPVYTHATGEGQAGVDSIAADINKRLSGNGTVTGATFGATSLSNVNAAAGGTELVAATSGAKMVFLRHRSVDGSGAATEATVDIAVGATDIARLNPGEAMCLPQFGVANTASALNGYASSGTVSVEVAIID